MAGLSMGACLAFRLAETQGTKISGLVVVNPSLAPDTRLFLLAPVLKHVIPSLPGIAGDIKKPGGSEGGYKRVPVKAAASMPSMWKLTAGQLAEVTQPLLVFRSAVDHVIGPASMRVLKASLPAAEVRPAGRQLPRRDAGQRRAGNLRRHAGVHQEAHRCGEEGIRTE